MLLKFGIKEKIKITRSYQAFGLMHAYLSVVDEMERDKEHFFVLGLSRSHNVKFLQIVSIGTMTETLVKGREVFRASIKYGAAVIILGHNHPSGNTSPSDADIEVTNKMVAGGKLLGIDVVDHIIVTFRDGYYSFADNGKIN